MNRPEVGFYSIGESACKAWGKKSRKCTHQVVKVAIAEFEVLATISVVVVGTKGNI